jgi:quinol-cytochrome oxidoreductase complex cytochrome b subunit
VFKFFYFLLLFDVFLLGYVGAKPAEGIYITISRFGASYYFCHFLVIIPIISKYEINQLNKQV